MIFQKLPIIVDGLDYSIHFTVWKRLLNRKYFFRQLGYTIREITPNDAKQPFEPPHEVKWTLGDFLNEHKSNDKHSFVVIKNNTVSVAFTLQYPSNCKCYDKNYNCLKLHMLARNIKAEDDNPIVESIINGLDQLASYLSLTCIELDSLKSLQDSKRHYEKFGYKECDGVYTEDYETMVPMRKVLLEDMR